MNFKAGSLLLTVFLAITAHAAPVTILEKQMNLGADPKTQKTLIVKAYSFVDNNTQASAEQIWLSAFALDNNLFFLTSMDTNNIVFPITQIISTASTSEITIDPTAENPNQNQTEITRTPSKSALITIKNKFSDQLQIFKAFSILLAQGNTKALASFIEMYSSETIRNIIIHATLCQGRCYFKCEEIAALDTLIQAKKPITEPVTFTGEITFLPAELVAQEFIEEAEQIEKEQNAAKTLAS